MFRVRTARFTVIFVDLFPFVLFLFEYDQMKRIDFLHVDWREAISCLDKNAIDNILNNVHCFLYHLWMIATMEIVREINEINVSLTNGLCHR